MTSPAEPDLDERIALFRHALVSRVLAADLSAEQRRGEIRRIVEAEHQIPGTHRTRIAEGTLRDWIRAWRRGGFEALKPRRRIDEGRSRALAPAVADRLCELKEAEATLTIDECIERVLGEGLVEPDARPARSSVHRLFSRAGLTGRTAPHADAGVDRRRFAFRDAGQLWTSDVCHGPTLVAEGSTRRRRKSYLIAFLDDATRVVPHAAFAFSEGTQAFLPVMKQALLRRGIPQRLYVDNGAAYRSHHLALVCARLDIALIHAKSRSPQGKGKIERFFRTVRAQLFARMDEADRGSLEAANRRLQSWIEGEYHHRAHRGLEDATPLEQWALSAAGVRYPDPDVELDDLFLFETRRRVASDRTVSLDGRLYEVDAALIGERVTLRFDPSRPQARVQVVHEGAFVEHARVVDPYQNCFVKRDRQSGAPDTDTPPTPPPKGLAMRRLQQRDGRDGDGGGPQ